MEQHTLPKPLPEMIEDKSREVWAAWQAYVNSEGPPNNPQFTAFHQRMEELGWLLNLKPEKESQP